MLGKAGTGAGWDEPLPAAGVQGDQRGAIIPTVLPGGCRIRMQDGGGLRVSMPVYRRGMTMDHISWKKKQ